MKKPVTVWKRRSKDKPEWQHNHIEDGWSHEDEPKVHSEEQRKAWSGDEWRATYMWLDEEGKLV